ncbi:MAG TPA: FAD binding domain-containing protein, partial [Jatrophihabitans sp.]|nr:FAD binding domain-containing protein [Jatrophihabitans sp.]
PATLVDLKRIAELNDISVDGARLRVGAGATHDEIARHPMVRTHAPLLAAVEERVGNARVRAQGTLGGNVCFAEPRSDVIALLIAVDARLVLRSPAGERDVPAADFVLGPYWTDRAPDELLVRAEIALPCASGTYLKLQLAERPTVGVAAVRTAAARPCRVVVGAAIETPQVFEYDTWDAVDAAEIAAGLEPVSDLAGSAAYKRHVTEVYVRRAVAQTVGHERDE